MKMAVNVAGSTVNPVVFERLPTVAVIVDAPARTGVNSPVVSMDATPGCELFQDAESSW